VLWPGPAGDEGNCRRLDGEIQLSKHLKPSSAMMHFSITVRIFFSFFDHHGTHRFVSNSFVLASTTLWYFHSKRLPSTLPTKVPCWRKTLRLGLCLLKGQGRKYILMKGEFRPTGKTWFCILLASTHGSERPAAEGRLRARIRTIHAGNYMSLPINWSTL